VNRLGAAPLLLAVASALSACGPTSAAPPYATPTAVPTRPPHREGLVIAVLGDEGWCATHCDHEQAVADLVHNWVPDYIVNVGDSTYSTPIPSKVLADMRPWAEDVAEGRMLSLLGNEDYGGSCNPEAADPVRSALLITRDHGVEHLGGGLLDLLFVNSTCGSADGYSATSRQAHQYAQDLAASTARWRITLSHHPEYSSGPNGGLAAIRWVVAPGVDLFIAGHDHDFEHLEEDGRSFVVDGAGGRSLYKACAAGCVPGSLWHDDTVYGAVRLTVTEQALTVDFVAASGRVLHSFTLHKG
jgi:Calcineurin-like phosphoesterase